MQSSASKGQSSLWSIFQNKATITKQRSASLMSLDSNRSENLSDWQGSLESCLIDNQLGNQNEIKDDMFYDEELPKLQSHDFECIDNLPFEEVSEFHHPQPQVLKAKG